MSLDASVTLPRGRPPTTVLVTLTLVASLMHGCVLDGMPLDGLPIPAHAALPTATSLQVRQIAMPEPEADRTVAAAVQPADPPATVPAPRKDQPAAQRARAAGAVGPEAPVGEVVRLETPEPPAPLAVPLAALAPASAAAEASAAALDSPPLRQPERPVPVYKTRIPPLTTIEYEIRRGGLSGTGELSWRPASGHYEARLAASIAGFTLLTQISQGGFDAAGLAPTRFTDQRVRKAARAANFQRDAGKITFSGPRDEYALAAGSQDRLSWMIQLPAVIAGEPKRAASGGEVVLYIAGARGDVDLWDLRSSGIETIETPSGALQTVKFTRTPRTARDTLAEVWLDPKRHYLPVRARLTQSDSDGALDLVLRELHTSP